MNKIEPDNTTAPRSVYQQPDFSAIPDWTEIKRQFREAFPHPQWMGIAGLFFTLGTAWGLWLGILAR